MPPRRKQELKEADWPPDRTMRILKQQREALQSFRGKTFREVDHEEQEWAEFTLSALIHGFGEGSQNESTRLNSSHLVISYAVFCLKKKKKKIITTILININTKQ